MPDHRVGRRRRWTDEEKAWIVAESLDPTITVSAVARRYGLHASQLFTWGQQLASAAMRQGPAFVPVVVALYARWFPSSARTLRGRGILHRSSK
jgi:transposase